MLVECKQMSMRYGKKTVFENVSFSLPEHSITALVGENGIGKTTLSNLLCGFYPPSLGSIRVLGEQAGSHKLLGKVGVLPQDARLDPHLTIGKQLRLLASLHTLPHTPAHEADRVLCAVKLEQHAKAYPGELSHGMRKRASIAQALLGQPKLLILDEPSSGLDPLNADNIRNLIEEQAQSASIIVSSHNLAELNELCDHYLYLNNSTIHCDRLPQNEANTAYIIKVHKQDMDQVYKAIVAACPQARVEKQHNGQIAINQLDEAGFTSLASTLEMLAQQHVFWKHISRQPSLETVLYNNVIAR